MDRLRIFGGRSSPLLFLAVLSTLYFAVLGHRAVHKPLWFDEICTVCVTGQPSMTQLWAILRHGPECNPPLYYLLVRAASVPLGQTALAARLPSLVGVWVLCLCLYLFISRWGSRSAAAVTTLLPLVTLALSYATEARPYGWVLGCAGLAVLCWGAVDGERRKLALVGLGSSVAAAACSHYFAVLLLFPLALGEATRAWRQRRLDWAVWGTLLASLVPLACWLPFGLAARDMAAGFWARPTLHGMLSSWITVPKWAWLFVVWPLLPLLARIRPERPPAAPPLHVWAATLGFVALPLPAYLLGLVTGTFTYRYVLLMVVGVAALAGLLASLAYRERSLPIHLALLGALAIPANSFMQSQRHMTRELAERSQLAVQLADVGDDLPIIVSSPLLYLELKHNGPARVAARLSYLSDPQAALRQQGFNTSEMCLARLQQHIDLGVADYASYASSGRHFLLYEPRGYLLSRLRQEGASVSPVPLPGATGLYLVTTGHTPPRSAANASPMPPAGDLSLGSTLPATPQ